MIAMTKQKQSALKWISDNETNLSDWHQIIWHFAETAFREYRSCDWYVTKLRELGFEVEEGSAGMPTAFAASWTFGANGPVIGAYVEYDAVPGNCQDATACEKPRAGLSKYAGGHTDPHSALGMGALGGVLATRAAMEKHGIAGTLKIFGEPAEKLRASKPFHAKAGYYDGIDAFISFHPAYMLPYFNTVRWDTHCGAAYGKIYEFICDEPQAWMQSATTAPIPAAHSSARAPGATDAVCMMHTATKMVKDNLVDGTNPTSISEYIMCAGQATADNLPQHVSLVQYLVRAPERQFAEQIFEVLDRNARNIADMTQCKMRDHWVTKSREGLPNHAIAELTYRNLELVGPPIVGEDAKKFARDIQINLNIPPMDEPFADVFTHLIDPGEAERQLREALPKWVKHYTSDDYTEYCWHAPTVRLYIGRPMLKTPENGAPYPAWVMNALGGHRASIDPMIICASRTISSTMLDLLTNKQALEATQTEFRERTGGGVGGSRWIAPQLPDGARPPIDFPWPEYVTTPRGTEWWIPTPSRKK